MLLVTLIVAVVSPVIILAVFMLQNKANKQELLALKTSLENNSSSINALFSQQQELLESKFKDISDSNKQHSDSLSQHLNKIPESIKANIVDLESQLKASINSALEAEQQTQNVLIDKIDAHNSFVQDQNKNSVEQLVKLLKLNEEAIKVLQGYLTLKNQQLLATLNNSQSRLDVDTKHWVLESDSVKKIFTPAKITKVVNDEDKTVHEFDYKEDGKISCVTKIDGIAQCQTDFSIHGAPLRGYVFDNDGNVKEEYVYDNLGQVSEKKEG